ncbi:protein ABHD11-like isoform X2 [Centruroides sculpturatus]|uniref:protein ABHD11-like isoform X2 n=1 Tax=Centruroides sculpturatus TaxID=218467 RepID=UPI000C6E33A2|nr:protein ABHD11-like isoform X2 [Centruroides sculpturatus]
MEDFGQEESEGLAYTLHSGEENNRSSFNTPIVIFHGLVDNKENWKGIATSLANTLSTKVYAVDMRNHGDSPKMSTINHEDNIEDLNNFLQKIGEQVILIGHNFGGTAAIDLAFKRPQLIKQLILIEASPLRYPENEISRLGLIVCHMFRAMLFVRKTNSFRKAREIFEEYFQDKIEIPALRDIILSNLREDTFGINWKVNLKVLEMSVYLDKIFEKIYPLHGVYHGRTLVIHTSTSESIATEEYGSLKKHFPNASFKCIENCSNWIHLDQPDELCDIISEYVASI